MLNLFARLFGRKRDPKTTTGGFIALLAALLNLLCSLKVVCLDIPAEVLETIMGAGIAIVGYYARDRKTVPKITDAQNA
jgi:hypothetical protein